MYAIILSALLLDGPLPWSLPSFPAVPTTAAPSVTLDEMEHSDTYEDQQADIEDQIGGWSTPITELSEVVSNWFGPTGSLPDTTDPDFEVGMTPLDEIGTSDDLAHWLGAQIGAMFSYIRALATMPGMVIGTLITLGLVCACLLMLVKGIDFGMSIFDALWSFSTKIIDLLGQFLPTGG